MRSSLGEGATVNLSVFQWTTTIISLLAAIGQLCILRILLKRKMCADFPIFVAFNAIATFTAFALGIAYMFPAFRTSERYFALYWILNGIVMLLQFGIIYEIFVNALKPYAGLVDLGRMLFAWAAVFLVITSVLTAVASVGPFATKCVAALTLLQRTLGLMQCGLLLLFFFFERKLALSWRSYAVSLAMGLGVCAALGFTLSFVRVHFLSWNAYLDVLDNASYFAVVVYWVFCFGQAEPARKNVLDSPQKLIFQRWNEGLLAAPMLSHDGRGALAPVDSFLPGIERTVEKVLARKLLN